jgi:hypothetical protein
MAKLKYDLEPVEQSDLQKLAQKENYAIFQLKGMLGNLVHVRKVPNTSADLLQEMIRAEIKRIKNAQAIRELKRRKKGSKVK